MIITLLDDDPVLLNVNLEAREVVWAHYSFRPVFALLSRTNFVDFEVDSLVLQISDLGYWLSDREPTTQMRLEHDCEWDKKGWDDASNNKRDIARVRRASVALDDSLDAVEHARMLVKFVLEATRLRELEIRPARYQLSRPWNLALIAMELEEAGTVVNNIRTSFKTGY